MKVRLFVAAALVSSSFSTAPAAAQLGSPGFDAGRFDTRGFMLGVHLSGSQLASDGVANPTVPRGGLGLTLGYGINGRLTAFVRGTSAYQTAQLDAGARYRFGAPAQRLRPYVEAAVTGISTHGRPQTNGVGDPVESARSTGTGFTAGAGVEYYVGPRLGVDLGVTHSLGRFSHPVDSPYDRSFSATRLHLGLTWRP